MDTTSTSYGLIDSQPAQNTELDPRLVMLLWVCGKTLILVFLIIVIATMLPFNPRSVEWGMRLSNRIIDTAYLPLIGVALLRVGSLLLPWPEARADSATASRHARRRHSARQFAHRGVVSLSLLAVWHVPLLLGSVTLIEQRNAVEAMALTNSLRRYELVIRRASSAEIEQQWQEISQSRAIDLPEKINSPQQLRSLLISQIERRRQQASQMTSRKGNEALFSLVHNALRSLALCLAYIAGFHALGRRNALPRGTASKRT
jgi:hypothetical protein